jgi:hypothetical protein
MSRNPRGYCGKPRLYLLHDKGSARACKEEKAKKSRFSWVFLETPLRKAHSARFRRCLTSRRAFPGNAPAAPCLILVVEAVTQAPQVEVVLRDFDGTRTIYPAELPLRDMIHTEQTDLEFAVDKIYVRTDERDERGRTIYSERR